MSTDGYAARAQEYAPRSIAELRAAARQMLRDGLGEHSIADALRLDVDAVRRLLGECQDCGA